ncbi:DUF2489 domain-containing protein [Colwelliaceae bacterium BS250]
MTMLLIVASLVVVALVGYAIHLLLKLKSQTKQQKHTLAQNLQAQNDRDVKTIDSVVLICRAMIQKQCELSEGCWRLSMLMNSLTDHIIELNDKFPAIFKLYSDISHMPILEARKALTKQQKLAFDLERMGVEQALEVDVYVDLELLLPFAESLKKQLTKQQQ